MSKILKLITNIKLPLFFSLSLFILLCVVNAGLISSEGTSDTTAWTRVALATIKYQNPFVAHIVVGMPYPPLSAVFLGFFPYLWKVVLGSSPDYALATKIGIFVFYIATFVIYRKFASFFKKKGGLVFLSLFSLIIATQGLAYIDIYTAPFIILTFFTFYKRQYLLSGLFYGITLSIKWQYTLLVPIFILTVPGFENKIIYLVGLVLMPVFSWFMVLREPNGISSLISFRSFMGSPYLSGQALNLNWVFTYVLHLINPGLYGPISLYSGYTAAIKGIFPPFLKGYFFYAAYIIIIARYFLFQKKNFVNLLTISVMAFLSHSVLNVAAHENHLFYSLIPMLLLYTVAHNKNNLNLLILIDVMYAINLVMFYGISGAHVIRPVLFGFDMTVLISVFYVVIYFTVFWNYLKRGRF